MNTTFPEMLDKMTATTPEPEDYTGEDGLLYCGKCRKPKEAYFAPDKAAIFGRDRHPAECDCQRVAREEREADEERRRHLDTVEELKRRGFIDPTMREWTFENDNGENPQTGTARFYAEHWDTMKDENIGYLFWGDCRHRQKLSCGLYRKRSHGERNPRLHDELCSYPQRPCHQL